MKIHIKEFPKLHWGKSDYLLNNFDVIVQVIGDSPFCKMTAFHIDPFAFIGSSNSEKVIIGPEIPIPDSKCLEDKFFGLIKNKYTNPKIMEEGVYWASIPKGIMFRYDFWNGLLRVYGKYPFFKSEFLWFRDHIIFTNFTPSDCRIGPKLERITI